MLETSAHQQIGSLALLCRTAWPGFAEPTADQVLQQQEPEFRNRVLAQESLAVREAEANAALEAQAALAGMNR